MNDTFEEKDSEFLNERDQNLAMVGCGLVTPI